MLPSEAPGDPDGLSKVVGGAGRGKGVVNLPPGEGDSNNFQSVYKDPGSAPSLWRVLTRVIIPVTHEIVTIFTSQISNGVREVIESGGASTLLVATRGVGNTAQLC